MSINRRRFLTGSLQAGAVLVGAPLLASPLFAESNPGQRPILLLHSAGNFPVASAIQRTWRAMGVPVAASLMLDEELLFDTVALRRALRDAKGMRLVGVMDACSDTLLGEAIRDVGGTLLLRGTHAHSATVSLHVLQTATMAQGCGAAMATALEANGEPFSLGESAYSGAGTTDMAPAMTLPSGDWSMTLGAALALVAAGTWQPAARLAPVRSSACQGANTHASCISLIADI